MTTKSTAALIGEREAAAPPTAQLPAIEPADMRERLRASALRIAELRGHLEGEVALRDDLIVAAVEQLRMPQREVAKAAGVNQQRVHQILADH